MASNNSNSSNKNDIQASKLLSKILRHNAGRLNLQMDANGYCVLDEVIVKMSTILKHQHITKQRVMTIVQNCPKQRFKIEMVDGVTKIRANQGHTVQHVQDMELKEITEFEEGVKGKIIHGTNNGAWRSIKETGLNKMKRNHIHMARGEFGDAKSGARWNSEVIITIDGNKAIQDGIKFFESDNGVILSPGNEAGTIPPDYFVEAFDRKSNKRIFP